MRTLTFLIFLFIGTTAFAQDWGSEDDILGKNLGMRLGTGMYSMYGAELQNPRPKTGFQAGMYLYGKKPEKRLNWQTGLEATFMGSNFKNEDSFGIISSSHYTQLGIIQLDVPLLLNIRTAKYSDTRYDAVQVGVIAGNILRSVIYVGAEKTPQQQTNLEKWENLPLQPLSLHATVGYQHIGTSVGYNFRLRCSVLDMNRNFVLPGLIPVTGTGKWIGILGAEFALLF